MKTPGEVPTQEEAAQKEVTVTPEIAEALDQNTVAFLDAMEKRIQDNLGLPEWVRPQNKVERYAMIAVVCGWQGDRALELNGHVENRQGEELPAAEQSLIRELYEPSGILAELEANVRRQLAASYKPEKDELSEKVRYLGLKIAAPTPTLQETLVVAQKKYHNLITSGKWGRVVTPICAEDLLAYQALKAGEYRNPQDIIYGRE